MRIQPPTITVRFLTGEADVNEDGFGKARLRVRTRRRSAAVSGKDHSSKWHQRIEIIIRNIDRELPESAVGILTIDFEDAEAFQTAKESLAFGLTNLLEQAVILKNERGESLGFNPHHYSHHRAHGESLGPRRAPDCRWIMPSRNRDSQGNGESDI